MADADARARRFLLQRFADYIALEQGLSLRTQEPVEDLRHATRD